MSLKEALDLQPLPWSAMAVFAIFLLYGLWPALKPEHFRQTSLRYVRPRAVEPFVMPTDLIRIFGVIWVLMCGFALFLGLAARL
jgi:hypothetical protein